MFTGIIAATGKVKRSEIVDGDLRLTVESSALTDASISVGDSVAVNGVCLTVIVRSGAELQFDVSRESLGHTLIADWKLDTTINLELALQPNSRLGGHFVSGHVDGVATLTELAKDARSWRMQFEVSAELAKYIAKKGSVTLDGISLTVNAVDKNQFDVNIVPHTWQETSLANVGVGDKVHLEVDLIARYLERLLEGAELDRGYGVTRELLVNNGFISTP